MALLLAVVVWGLALLTVGFLHSPAQWFPPGWSAAAAMYDKQFALTLAITGVAFIAAQLLLGWFIWKYRDRGTGRARYVHGHPAIEFGGIAVTAIAFVGLAIAGQRVWAQVHLTASPPDALHIEVTGQQFNWQIRYSGKDGKFGRIAPKFYDKVANPVGLDSDDPEGRDDIVSPELVVPVDRAVELTLRSWDVIHSFFLPTLRIKQDAVPGLTIPMRFRANTTGDWEIACAELCGTGHYTMRTFLRVKTPAEYEQWLAEQAPQMQPAEGQGEAAPAPSGDAGSNAVPAADPGEPAAAGTATP